MSNPCGAPTVRAIRDTDKLIGYLALWGSPDQVDCYGTWFDRSNPPNLGLLPDAPIRLMYEHGLDKEIGKTIIGSIERTWHDERGVAFEAVLYRDSGFYDRIVKEVQRGVLGVSSASAEHLADFAPDGRFINWLITEVSLTKHPCEQRLRQLGFQKAENGSVRAILRVMTGNTQKDGVVNIRNMLEDMGIDPSVDAVALLAALVERDGLEAVQQILASFDYPSDDVNSGEQAQDTTMSLETAIEEFAETLMQEREDEDEDEAPRRTQQVRKEQAKAPSKPVNKPLTEERFKRLLLQAMASKPASPAAKPRSVIESVVDMRYDHVPPAQLGMAFQITNALKATPGGGDVQLSPSFMRALAYRTALAVESNEIRDPAFRARFRFADGRPIRANEVMGTGQTGFGSQWAEDLPGTVLWEAVRLETPLYGALLAAGMDEREIPRGYKSETIPVEGADATWYVAPEATDLATGATIPTTTFNSSKVGTGERQLTVAKLSAAVPLTSVLEEDSIIDIAGHILDKLRKTATEQIEYILLNGDTVLTANTNLNLIDGTPAAVPARPSYTLLNGLLKLPIITTTTLSRAASSPFSEVDFLETLKLFPRADRSNASGRMLFVLDSDTAVSAMNIASIKTRDVFSAATIEEGLLTRIFRIPVLTSGFMPLANTAGKVSATPANNTRGRLLLVRPDRWAFRWKRQLEIITERYGYSDTWGFYAHMRFGMINFSDTSGAAATYNINLALS